MSRFLTLSVLLLTAAVASAQQQKDTLIRTLDEVVVTANKIPQKQSTTGKVVSVIDQATLQRNAGKTITEILNYQAGVFIVGANNTLGANLDVYFRGANTGNVLILMDGVPVSDPSQIDNSYDLNNIATDQVERIEILKGAQSTLWGSDAMVAVINIITKKGGSKKFGATALLSYGSYNTVRGAAGINGTVNKFSYNVNYNFTGSDGFSAAYDSTGAKNFDKDGFHQNNVQANLKYNLSSRFAVKGLFSQSQYRADLDAGAFADDKNYRFSNKNFINNLELIYTGSKISLHLSNAFIKAERVFFDDSSSQGSSYIRGNYNGNSRVTELYGNISVAKKLSWISGLQYISQKTDQHYLSITGYGTYETALGDSAIARNFSIYNSMMLTDAGGFNMEAGFRYNYHSIYGNNTTFTFNPSYNLNENSRVFLNISSGYKIPSLYQLYSEYGDKDLKPEASLNYELGVQTFSNQKRNSLRITGFIRDTRNLIVFYTDTVTYSGRYINRDRQHDYGIELESTISIGNFGSWVSNFTYVAGEGINDNVKTKNLYRRPHFTFNSMLTLQPFKGFTLTPSFRFVGKRLKGDYDAGPDEMPPYHTVDCYAAYEFSKSFRVFADCRNITDQQYFDVPGYNSRGRNIMTGISLNF